jgi:hypothetical protein
MAVAIKDAIRAVVPDPKTSTDSDARAAYQIARLIRNAFAHAPFAPTWSIDPDCRGKVFSIPDVITLDTTSLQGTPFDWRHYGGPLALFRVCRFVRINVLKDPVTPRKVVPIPRKMLYQQGDLILKSSMRFRRVRCHLRSSRSPMPEFRSARDTLSTLWTRSEGPAQPIYGPHRQERAQRALTKIFGFSSGLTSQNEARGLRSALRRHVSSFLNTGAIHVRQPARRSHPSDGCPAGIRGTQH